MKNFLKVDLGKYDKFLYGLLAGVVLGIIITAFQILTFLAIVNVFLSSLIFLKIAGKPKLNLKSSKPSFPSKTPKVSVFKSEKREGCPECGSTRRHKKWCSRAKK